MTRHCISLLWSAAALFLVAFGSNGVSGMAPKPKRLSRQERKELAKKQMEEYAALKSKGVDEVSHSAEAAAIRHYQLRKKKRKGVLRRETDLATILFPGVSPEQYNDNESVLMYVDLVTSKKTQVPFDFYDLPTCPQPDSANVRKVKQRKNLGARLQGHEILPAPYVMKVKQDMGCTPLCQINIAGKKLRWMRKLVDREYRINLKFDDLPVLMRSQELNAAFRGYPVGFKAPPTHTGLKSDEFFLYNHLKFTITYREAASEFEGIRVTGFDVHPVSIQHDIGKSLTSESTIKTCNAPDAPPVVNDPNTYLPLRTGPVGEALEVLYSYEVEWIESDLVWSDRWDVYLIGAPADDVHFFAIINSLMIVLLLTGAIGTIMIRTLRKDIAGYNEMQTLEESQEETGWKLVHGDVFRPPQNSSMLLSVAVGTGAQIGMAFLITMLCAIVGLLNPMKKGQTLTAIIILYVLCGSVAGYVSARLAKFCDTKAWKEHTFFTATALPGVLVGMFIILNIFLSMAGAATAVSFLTIIALFLLWVCVSTPLVFAGSFFGFRAAKIDVPTKTNQIARFVPEQVWYATPPVSYLLGGILPFGSVCIELFFIMSALWLHQIYYVMGFLLAVILILAATCAEVSVVMTYLQLCSENHRWWWDSFFNSASAGVYLFAYSLWFLISRLELVGFLPVIVYLTYMTMISICFGLFCGSIGVLSSFFFVRSIYGAVKVD
mmetsp:Transcript_2025/g.2484  ORF Transcript_2025/g.2484 Transcript_2025/m.2484 type:complete len:719 (+) Transcript_2025:55-2211(+)